MAQIPLSVEESLAFAQEQAYWDGFAAGAKAAADHVKELAVQKVLNARRQEATVPPPPDPTPSS